ncbi:PREDICTED: olfactory receptor 52W1-like [Gekko japonicus]|uniref:Olfactory receptor n=1 Tax=Gekko japonicus TaxID=146911 RepID=A0ABM1KU58_GEKJA|nr:PREDICTED: olfactory receptor 52W1-like [Gekko japonicus]
MPNASQTAPSSFLLVGIPGLEAFHGWLSVPFCCMYLMALLGNVSILLIVQSDPALHQPMFLFLCILAATDLGLSTSIAPKMLAIFWLDAREIGFEACLAQMFFLHAFTAMESGVLLAMAFDRFVAIRAPLRYGAILTPRLIAKVALALAVRAVVIVIPFPLLVRRFRHFRSNVIAHCYCEHMALVKLVRGDTTANNLYGLILSLSVSGLDLAGISSSYALILQTVWRLPSREAQRKAFGTCGSHISIILVFYIPGLFSYLTHRFGHRVPQPVHIILSILYLLVPPMLNPLVYGAKTKQIRTRLLKLFFLAKGGP